jgi:hypothetical protein
MLLLQKPKSKTSNLRWLVFRDSRVQQGRTDRDATDGVLPSETHPTPSVSGSTDPSRVSAQDPEKKDLDKQVRSLTTLTA